MFGLLMFTAGVVLGMCVTSALWFYWWTMPTTTVGKHIRNATYPRKTTMPKEGKRIRGRPTNISEPPATVRQAQFRNRRHDPRE
jgi:uncharacterized membrane protein YedE/YeeE